MSRNEEAWNAALDVLKPSRKDLEHGLELHANSLVIEPYGFLPLARVDKDKVLESAGEGASGSELSNLFYREAMTRNGWDPAERAALKAALDDAGVTCIGVNVGEQVTEFPQFLAHYTYKADLCREFCPRAVSPEDILAAKKAGRHCVYFSMNGVPLPEKWESVQGELKHIRLYHELGVRMMHLTYNRGNVIGQGCGEKNDGGLTDFGRQVVAEMNRVGVLVDVAHSGHQTSLDAAKVSEKPIVASHTVAHALSGHCRGKPDRVIQAIVEKGGAVGVCCYAPFLGLTWDIRAFLDHIDHIARKFGTDAVMIASDLDYVPLAGEKKATKPWPKGRPGWFGLWPAGSLDMPPDADPRAKLSLAWTNWPLFTVGLVQRGYRDEEIQNILGGNMFRIVKFHWDSREP